MCQPTDVFRSPAQPRSFLSYQAAVCGRSYRFDKGENNAFRWLRLKILMVSALMIYPTKNPRRARAKLAPGAKNRYPRNPPRVSGTRDSLAGKARPAFESRGSGSMRRSDQLSTGFGGSPCSAALKGIAIAGLDIRAYALPHLYVVGRLAFQETPQD